MPWQGRSAKTQDFDNFSSQRSLDDTDKTVFCVGGVKSLGGVC